jgi:YlmC/YmxH family sporulation protein
MSRGYELRNKEVININTAEKLGYVADVEFGESSGNIEALIVPGRCGLWSKLRGKELIIPWDMIEVVGKDVILVKMFETM